MNVVTHGTFSIEPYGQAVVAPDSYRAPGYPGMIALLIWLGGDLERVYYAILAIQCILGAGTVALSILLSMRFVQKGYAYAVGMLIAVWPHLVTLGGYVLTETTFGFLVVLSIYFIAEALEKPGLGRIVSAALTLAMAALVNQVLLGLTVLFVAWFCLVKPWRSALLFALLSLGPPALWALR